MALEAVKAEYPDVNIKIIDSKTASIGVGVMLTEAIEMKNAGKSLEELADRMHYMADNLITLFTLSDLNWVAQGGRISTTAASIGSVLQINSVMQLIDGAVTVTEKIRGKKRVTKRMLEIIKDEADQIEKQILGVAYSENPKKGEDFLAEVEEHFNARGVIFQPIGSSIASHAGLGTLGIAFLKKYSD